MQYPHIFEEAVLENIKNWVIDDTVRFHSEHHNCKSKKASDYEMLKSYSTGLLAVGLARYVPGVNGLCVFSSLHHILRTSLYHVK